MTNQVFYTEAPPNSYMLWQKFSLTVGEKSITAFAVSNSAFGFIIALYAILIQFFFVGLWKVVVNVMLVTMNVSDEFNMLGVVAFWNSPDPLAAFWASSHFSSLVLFRGNKIGVQSRQRIIQALAMSMTALIVFLASLVAAILVPNQLQLAQAAPVHPAAIFWPRIDAVTNATVSQSFTQGRPGALRALGSAEAADFYHSAITSIHFKPGKLSLGQVDGQPKQSFTYNYQITSEELGLQIFPDLRVKVSGSCTTEYGWLRKNSAGWDEYVAWNTPTRGNIVPVANEKTGNVFLDFAIFLHPGIDDESQARNRSFAFAVTTSQMPSISPSIDPWYYTESSNNTRFGAPSVVKSGRPVLSCWETIDICARGACYDSRMELSPFPEGLVQVFKTRFAIPASARVALIGGVSALKSYAGSINGAVLDAQSLSMTGDMERLILAGYLYSRQIFSEIVFSSKPSGVANSFSGESGTLMEGIDQFVVSSANVAALRLDVVVLVPACFVLVWLIALVCAIFRHGQRPDRTFNKRAIALSATGLFRMRSELITGKLWPRTNSSMPLPPDSKEDQKAEIMLADERDRCPNIEFPPCSSADLIELREERDKLVQTQLSGDQILTMPLASDETIVGPVETPRHEPQVDVVPGNIELLNREGRPEQISGHA